MLQKWIHEITDIHLSFGKYSTAPMNQKCDRSDDTTKLVGFPNELFFCSWEVHFWESGKELPQLRIPFGMRFLRLWKELLSSIDVRCVLRASIDSALSSPDDREVFQQKVNGLWEWWEIQSIYSCDLRKRRYRPISRWNNICRLFTLEWPASPFGSGCNELVMGILLTKQTIWSIFDSRSRNHILNA